MNHLADEKTPANKSCEGSSTLHPTLRRLPRFHFVEGFDQVRLEIRRLRVIIYVVHFFKNQTRGEEHSLSSVQVLDKTGKGSKA